MHTAAQCLPAWLLFMHPNQGCAVDMRWFAGGPLAFRMPASCPELMAFARVVLASWADEEGTCSPTPACTP